MENANVAFSESAAAANGLRVRNRRPMAAVAATVFDFIAANPCRSVA
jgi:hypothetical protein